ncbi:MAG: hypothetical protein WC580_05140 [Agrococcus sp.]
MHRSSRCAEPSRRARVRRLLTADAGSASIEFLSVAVLLLVPLVYLVLALGQIQHAVLGVEGAARHAARTIAQADSHDAGLAAADRALLVAMTDAGLPTDAVRVAISCAPDQGACHTARGTVTVQVDATVPLPLAPPFLGLDVGLGVPVSARAVQPVSAFGGVP